MSRLKEIREEKKLKQEELAAVIDVSVPTYNKKENGSVKVSLIEAKKLAVFLGKTIDELFFNDEVSIIDTKSTY